MSTRIAILIKFNVPNESPMTYLTYRLPDTYVKYRKRKIQIVDINFTFLNTSVFFYKSSKITINYYTIIVI